MRALVRAMFFGSIFSSLLAISSAQNVPSPEAPALLPQPVSAPATRHSLAVTFDSGKLTIAAENCSLQEVLQEIQKKTGTAIEGAAYDNNPVTTQLGPDDPMRVMAALLYGSKFNYIIVAGRDAAPNKIVLSARNVVAPISAPAPVIAQAAPPAEPPVEKAAAEGSGDENKLLAEAKTDDKADDKQADEKKKDDDQKDGDKKDKDEVAKIVDDKSVSDMLADAGLKSAAAGSEPGMAERLTNLPSDINPAIASLYPSLFGGSGGSNLSSTSTAGNFGSGVPYNQTGIQQAAYNGPQIQYNAAGVPILPSNINPDIWNIYPKNLMDLIRSGGSNPGAVVVVTTPMQQGFWDQTIRVPTGH